MNCAACGKGCDGGCVGGVCQPVLLAGGLNNPAGIAVDATSVYWVDEGDGTVMKCAIAGCSGAPSVLAAGQTHPVAIAVDTQNVYWIGGSLIMRLRK